MTQQHRDDPRCHGRGTEHCCYVPGRSHPTLGDGVCPFLEVDTMPGRHWVCGKRRALGSWAKVHRDREYREVVASVFAQTGTALCGDWQIDGQCCFSDSNPPVYF